MIAPAPGTSARADLESLARECAGVELLGLDSQSFPALEAPREVLRVFVAAAARHSFGATLGKVDADVLTDWVLDISADPSIRSTASTQSLQAASLREGQ